MGSDLNVVNAARVSFAKTASEMGEREIKLLQYLAKHKHWTPFAQVQVSLHIRAPLFVRAQLYKHKVGLVENEESRRYVDDMPEFYEPDRYRLAPEKSRKQGSGETLEPDSEANILAKRAGDRALSIACDTYDTLIKSGIAPEMARMWLPQSMYTQWHWTGSLAAFHRVYLQRTDPHAQWETQEYGHAIGRIVADLFPESWKALTA